MNKILLIDDDEEVLEINKKYLVNNKCDVMVCSEPLKAIMVVESFKPDCILLDVMMPNLNGFELCKRIRSITEVPILFLSGKVSEDDKIKGFQCGCNDYIEKPYSIKEVYVRIISNINRYKVMLKSFSKRENNIYIYPLVIDIENHKVLFNDNEIPMSNREYDLLLYMSKRRNELITFEEIGIATWGTYAEQDRRTVMVNVSRLRKRLLDYTGMDNIIETVWSKGYKLNVSQ